MPNARRKPWVAGLLSLFTPGLGQIYNGHVKRGLLFYCLFWVLSLAALIVLIALSFPFNFVVTILIVLSVYLYIIIDSIRSARRLGDTYQLKTYNKLYMYLMLIAISSLVVQPALQTTVREIIVQAFKIPSGSMIPTLQIGENILVNKMAYGIRIPFWGGYMVRYSKPERGDVVVFVFPKDRSKDFIKRVIGVEGDLVEIRKKKVYINGQLLDDPYAHFEETTPAHGWLQFRDNYAPERVPENRIFVMGDNRDRSHDSRFWGFVDMKGVKGKAFMVYWSWDRGVRWERIGMEIQ